MTMNFNMENCGKNVHVYFTTGRMKSIEIIPLLFFLALRMTKYAEGKKLVLALL